MISKKPGKQRKYMKKSPLHRKGSMIRSNLSTPLRKKHSARSLRPVKGDKVKVMRGSFKGKTGAVSMVDIKNFRVYVEGCEKQKKDGSKVLIPINTSNIQITELKLDDKQRLKQLRTR